MVKMSRWLTVSASVFILLVQWIKPTEQKALDDYILDYQEVEYNPVDVHESHMRVKRSLDTHLYLRFKAYDRDFRLKLKTADSIFSIDHVTENSKGNLEPVDTSFIYEGSLVDVPESFIHMAILNGTLQGHIHVPDDTTYHVEPSKRFFLNPRFHSVIYSEKHMNFDPYRHLQENRSNAGHCGNDHAKEWMENLSKSLYEIPNRDKRSETSSEPSESFKYSEKANRDKRSTNDHPKKNTCFLYLRSDPTLWKYMKRGKYKIADSQPDLTDERAKAEIQAFFANHVSGLKSMFNTRFQTYDNSIAFEGITFLVQRTKIMTFESEHCGKKSASPYCNPNIDDNNFLNLNSLDNHNDFCLSFLFGNRDLPGGTLGLAFLAYSSRMVGGICEKFKFSTRKGVARSMNTGIVTILNFGKQTPPRISQITFSHEVGHAFGSPHDTGMHCAPFGTSDPEASLGNFLMFPHSTPGDEKHNRMFSICSKDNITRVLDAVFKQKFGKVNCFAEYKGSYCGNGILEEGEDCDCGFKEDCKDKCCNPKNSVAGECKLSVISGSKVKCSPSQGPCCEVFCSFVSKDKNQTCRHEDECSFEQLCEGSSATCSPSKTKPNLTLCNSNSQVCQGGKCTGSVCESIGWPECFLTSVDKNNKKIKDGPTKDELCYVSCLNKEKKCISSFQFDKINKTQNKVFRDLLLKVSSDPDKIQGIKLPTGSPCNNFRGYCDAFQRCRQLDSDGPLARLKNFMFSPENITNVIDWIVIHWWAVMIILFGMLVFMGFFIAFCSVHTPSRNPKLAGGRKIPMRELHQPNKPVPTRRTVLTRHGVPP